MVSFSVRLNNVPQPIVPPSGIAITNPSVSAPRQLRLAYRFAWLEGCTKCTIGFRDLLKRAPFGLHRSCKDISFWSEPMKTIVAFAVALLTCTSTVLADISSGETKRLEEAATVVRELRAAPDKGISEDSWSKAECVAVIPGLKKAAFLIGGEFGKGVISCRSGQTWSAPLFLELQKGSAGFQIGAEQVDVVLLMLNRRGVDKLLDNKVNLGADASVAAGPVGRAASGSTDARLTAEILAYSRAKGVFAGVEQSDDLEPEVIEGAEIETEQYEEAEDEESIQDTPVEGDVEAPEDDA